MSLVLLLMTYSTNISSDEGEMKGFTTTLDLTPGWENMVGLETMLNLKSSQFLHRKYFTSLYPHFFKKRVIAVFSEVKILFFLSKWPVVMITC